MQLTRKWHEPFKGWPAEDELHYKRRAIRKRGKIKVPD